MYQHHVQEDPVQLRMQTGVERKKEEEKTTPLLPWQNIPEEERDK